LYQISSTISDIKSDAPNPDIQHVSVAQLVRALHRNRQAADSIPVSWPIVEFFPTAPRYWGPFIIYTLDWCRREAKNTVNILFTQPYHWSK
jgi:hypothetical protein